MLTFSAPMTASRLLLSEAMEKGLFHPRCRHGLGTYYPELEDLNHYMDDGAGEYEGKTQDAHIENQIQKYERMAAGAVDPANSAQYTEKLRYWQRKQAQQELHKLQDSGIISGGESPRRITEVSASTISQKIASGVYSTKLSHQNYLKHVLGTAQYNSYASDREAKRGNPQSVLIVSEEQAQELILRHAGTGIVRTDRNGIPKPQESVNCGKTIGLYYGGGQYRETKKATIHYGKKSAHIVPIRGDDFD